MSSSGCRIRVTDSRPDANGLIEIEVNQPRAAMVREEAGHAAPAVFHGIAPKEVRVVPPCYCDLGVSPQPESFIRKVAMPSTMVGPMMGAGTTNRTFFGHPWPPPYRSLDARRAGWSDMRNLGRAVEVFEISESDYDEICQRARALTRDQRFLAVWERLRSELDRRGVLTKPEIERMFDLPEFTSWARWRARNGVRRHLRVRSGAGLEPAGGEVLRIRVPHSLYDKLPVGIRDPERGEQITFAQDGTDLVVTDVIGKAPQTDLTAGLWTTSPDGTGQRVEIDEDGIRLIDADDDVLANLPTDENTDPSFAGRLDARGIDIPQDTVGGSPAVQASDIRWLDADGTTLRGEIYSTTSGTDNNSLLFIRSIPEGGSSQGAIVLEAVTGTATFNIKRNADGTSQCEVTVGGVTRTLINSAGASAWLLDNAWANWTPTLTGYSANPTNAVYRYKQEGKKVTVIIAQGTAGTSNLATKTISLPVTAATVTNARWEAPARVMDNGVTLTTPGLASVMSGDTTVAFGKDWSAMGGFTASGNHRIVSCQLSYEAA